VGPKKYTYATVEDLIWGERCNLPRIGFGKSNTPIETNRARRAVSATFRRIELDFTEAETGAVLW